MTKLRWYEDLLLWLISRSPRISRIRVELTSAAPDDSDDDEQLDDPELDFVPFLEQMYQGPSAEREDQD